MTLEPTKTNSKIPQQDWHALKAEEVLKHLEVHENGLTSEEAKQRLVHYGENQLQESPRPGFLAMLWDQLNNFVVILLIVASVISALLGDYVEAAAHHGDRGFELRAGHCTGTTRRGGASRPQETCRTRCTIMRKSLLNRLRKLSLRLRKTKRKKVKS